MCRYGPTLMGYGSRRVPRDIIAMTDFRIGRFVAATFIVPAVALAALVTVASAQSTSMAPSNAAMAQGQAAAIAKARADSA